jgi:hypothetical protein
MECGYIIQGPDVGRVQLANLGASTSHLLTICRWLDACDDPVGFFCEDDLSLETVPFWNFTFEEFLDRTPKGCEAVQLVRMREEGVINPGLRPRETYDWGACAYVLTRQYAERLVHARMPVPHPYATQFYFDTANTEIIPVIEHMLFHGIGTVYNFPLFVESPHLQSTYDKAEDAKAVQAKCYRDVMQWWLRRGLSTKKQQLDNEHNTR